MRVLFGIVLCLAACTPKGGQESPPADDSTANDTADDTGSGTSYGPPNAWYHAPDASLVPEESTDANWFRGDQARNLRFTDQNGDEVWLYQFYGKQIYLDWVAEWCGPCATWAPFLDTFYQEHGEDAIVVTVLAEDINGLRGDADAVARWVADHGSTNPVVWLSAEEWQRSFRTESFPTIMLVDSGLRVAQRSVNTLYGDPYIEQVISRMEFALGGSMDNAAEVCGNGIDDELDFIADCMDPNCQSDASCALAEVTGSISPCTPAPDDADTTVDQWRVVVSGGVAELQADVVAEETAFENIVRIKAPEDSWDQMRLVGDDEWNCSYPLEDFGCALGWIEPGTWDLIVLPGTGGSELDGDCANPDFGAYALRTRGDVTLELMHDDVLLGSL